MRMRASANAVKLIFAWPWASQLDFRCSDAPRDLACAAYLQGHKAPRMEIFFGLGPPADTRALMQRLQIISLLFSKKKAN